eukprot:jgi/Chrzof1/13057/Cz07g18090.t1
MQAVCLKSWKAVTCTLVPRTPLLLGVNLIDTRPRLPNIPNNCMATDSHSTSTDQSDQLVVSGVVFHPFEEVQVTFQEVDDLISKGDNNQSLARLNFDHDLETAINEQVK